MQENQQVTTLGPAAQTFGIKIAGTDLNFRAAKVSDPVPTGMQIIEAAGAHPIGDYIALQWLPNGSLETLRPNETVDLRGKGVERFIVARYEGTTYQFVIDERPEDWPEPKITREVLLALAEQNPAKFTVWQERKGADQEILAGHPANLEPKGVERFYTVSKRTTEGGDVCPSLA
ncbi:MAG: multiubiquitin domain-containing protein [Afipia sp.]|nr:multiubiquitin domain-containing protein [Afipia sp.]